MAGTLLRDYPLHLGLGGTAQTLPKFTGDMAWYERYGAEFGADGKDGRLVSLSTFTSSWDMWEIHPNGAELVLCLEGAITLHQEHPDGQLDQVSLSAGEYAINPPGVWHTADVSGSATALFITAGEGTDHRPR